MLGPVISVCILLSMLPCKGQSVCSKRVCLEWTATENCLQLICQIYDLYLSVFIVDPNGNFQAECFPPFQSNCEAYYKNGTIKYNLSTNEVIFTVQGTINKDLNGYWACRHGLKGEITAAFVSVSNIYETHIYHVQTTAIRSNLTSSDTKQSKENANEGYGQKSTPNNTEKKSESEKGLSHVYIYGSLAGGLVLFLSLSVGVHIVISRQCRSVNLKNGEEVTTPNNSNSATSVNTDTESPQIENDPSVYETINENEMIQVSGDLGGLNETEAISANSCPSTSDSSTASNRSYLDVIDYSFYSKPYETLQCDRDLDPVHLYCTTIDQIEHTLDSTSTESSIGPHRNVLPEMKQESVVVTISPEQSNHSLLPTISNESAANENKPVSDIKEYGATTTSAIMLEMDCMDISDEAKTNHAHNLSKLKSNYMDMSGANSNRSIELLSSSNPAHSE